jgi:hypothetical protein
VQKSDSVFNIQGHTANQNDKKKPSIRYLSFKPSTEYQHFSSGKIVMVDDLL